MKKSIILLFLALLSIVRAAAVPKELVLVKNNKANFRIIVPDGKISNIMQIAVDVIVNLTQESTGASVSVIPENKLADAQQDCINLHLGLTEFVKKLNLDFPTPVGFMIHFADDKNIVCAGYPVENSELFHVDAASHFMEYFMGARFLLPGDLGTYVPERNDWVIKPENLRVVPDIWIRRWQGTHGQAFAKHERYQQQQAFHWSLRTHYSAGDVFRTNHNVGNLLDPEKYAGTHPEFFPLIDGKRCIPPKTGSPQWKLVNWEPCYTASGIAEETAKNLIEFFDQHPYSLSQSLSINDSGEICQCDNCKAKNSHLSPGIESQSYYEWVNKVVNLVNRKYPDRLYGLLDYWVTRELPEGIKLPGNVIPLICEDLKYEVDPELDRQLEERLNKWDKIVSSIGWWDYSFEGAYMVSNYNAPFIAKKLRHLYKNHNLRVYTDELYPSRYWKGGPQIYMIQKLCWDIDRDEEALITEWLELMVGKAAAPHFRQYFEIWANFWTNKIPETAWFRNRAAIKAPFLQRRDANYLDALDYQDVTDSMHYLEMTLAAAPEGKEKRRAEFYYRSFADAANLYLLPYLNTRKLSAIGKKATGKTVCEYTFDTDFKPWVSWQNPGHTAKLELDPAAGHTNPGALKLDRSQALETDMVFFRRPLDFKLESGKNYRISVWVKAHNLVQGSSARLWIAFPLAAGGELGPQPLGAGRLNFFRTLGAEELQDGQWHQLEVYVAVPATAWSALVTGINCQLEAFSKQTGGCIWFDDFKVEELALPQSGFYREFEVQKSTDKESWRNPETGELLGPELIVDGTMESPGVGVWLDSYSPKVKEKSTRFAHSGKRSLHIVSDSGGDGVLQIIKYRKLQDLFLVPQAAFKKDASYRVTLWVKNVKKDGCNEIRLAGTSLKEPLTAQDDQWHQFSYVVKYNKPLATPYLAIAYGTDQSDVYIDDVSVREIISETK